MDDEFKAASLGSSNAAPNLESAAEARRESANVVLQELLTQVVPALRRSLKAPSEAILRSSLLVLSHYVRTLAPRLRDLDSLAPPGSSGASSGTSPTVLGTSRTGQPHEALLRNGQMRSGPAAAAPGKQMEKAASAAPDVFGASNAAMLHADLLPLLRAGGASDGDNQGGDVFENVLHLQKHRRGRGLLALCKEAEAGRLTLSSCSSQGVFTYLGQCPVRKQ